MICFPNCKINLGLRVVRKRQDGFHDLETVFYPVHQVYDVLEIKEASKFSLQQQGLAIAGQVQDNIIYKAWYALHIKYNIPAVDTYLHKAIPSGAGLGGGSADGAFMLKLLNDYFKLGISKDNLQALALELGSDCPFFIFNTACSAAGRGEQLQEIALDLSGKYLQLVKPDIHVSTARAFSGITPQQSSEDLPALIAQPLATWRAAVVPLTPYLPKLKIASMKLGQFMQA
jgi:4-diphosphocytidyl-2-C-methyl-D-erythritol kinase